LDSTEVAGMPGECFISVRIGDNQKLSRLSSSRVFKFPKAGDRRYGKIEVFRRIGACSVDVDPDNKDLRELTINCGEAGFGTLGLTVAVTGEGPPEQLAEEPGKAQKGPGNDRVKAAKEYLTRHGLEVRLSEAMQAVLRARPEDPAEFIAAKLLGSTSTAGGIKLPALKATQRAGADVADKTLDEPQKLAMKPQKFEPLANATMPAAGLIEKPPVLPQKAQKQVPKAHLKPSVGTWLQAIPKPLKDAVVAKALPATFNVKPSVGTWLVPLPPGPKMEETQERRALLPTFKLRPSVGTWLAPRPPAPKPRSPPEQDAFKVLPSVGTWIAPLPRRSRRLAKSACADCSGATAGAGAAWAQRPSVGTWLAQPRLAPRAPRPRFEKRPSVGTWLAPVFEA